MRDIIIIREANSEEFSEVLNLRWRILRKPWNQPKGSETDDMENASISFIALLNDKIVGTARFHKNTSEEGQIRYLAIDEGFQRQNIGGKLIKYIEWYAMKQSKYIRLNARKTAENFFTRLGYKILEEGPLLYGEIPHFVMMKLLSP